MTRGWTAGVAVLMVAAAGCGGDDDSNGATGTTLVAGGPAVTADGSDDATAGDGVADAIDDTSDAPTSDAGSADDDADGDAGGAGDDSADTTLVFDGEAMIMMGSMCYLQEQDAAVGGGKILFVGQGRGTTADGTQPVLLDVSRYDEDSMFAGDSVSVVIGNPAGDDVRSFSSISETGIVAVDDSGMSAQDVVLLSDDDGSEVTATFTIDC